jgi:hypothetical protein
MRGSLTMCVMAVLGLIGPPIAAADPVTIMLARFVRAGASVAVLGDDVEDDIFNNDDGNNLTVGVPVVLAPNSASGTSSLISILEPNSRHLVGRGAMVGTADSPIAGDGTNASSGGSVQVEWGFRLDAPERFDFVGSFFTSFMHNGADAEAGAQWNTLLARITESGARRHILFSDSAMTSDSFTHAGRLAPGSYDFVFEASVGTHAAIGSARAASSAGFTFDLSPAAATPEPGTLALAGSGLVVIAAAMRRRKQTALEADHS